MTTIENSEQMKRIDAVILEELYEHRLDYVTLVANRRGLHLNHAKERSQWLEQRGLIEQTTDEVTYRITDLGESFLNDLTGKTSS